MSLSKSYQYWFKGSINSFRQAALRMIISSKLLLNTKSFAKFFETVDKNCGTLSNNIRVSMPYPENTSFEQYYVKLWFVLVIIRSIE